jgi:ethanolamine permease
MLVWLGLFGLVASFHGIIMGYARQIFALARAGFLPRGFARLHPRFRTPDVATVAGGVVGIAAIWSDNVVHIAGQSLTASVVTLSALGALTMYIVAMASLFRLRRTEPGLPRPFIAPAYPFAPGFALVMASVALVTMVWTNREIALIFTGLMVVLVGGSLVLRRR